VGGVHPKGVHDEMNTYDCTVHTISHNTLQTCLHLCCNCPGLASWQTHLTVIILVILFEQVWLTLNLKPQNPNPKARDPPV